MPEPEEQVGWDTCWCLRSGSGRDGEAADVLEQWRLGGVHVFNVVCHGAFLGDFLEEFLHLFLLSIDVEFDRAVG